MRTIVVHTPVSNMATNIFHLIDTRQIIFRYKEAQVKKEAKQVAENYAVVLGELGDYMRTGFAEPIRLSNRMAEFFGMVTTTNINLIQMLGKYTDIHNLTIPFTGLFLVDDALAKAFDVRSGSIRSYFLTITKPHITRLPISSAVKMMRRCLSFSKHN
jgi:hypothetical protein